MGASYKKLSEAKVMPQIDSKTLILVCQRAFSRILEDTLRSEGFANFRRGRRTIDGATTAEGKEDSSEVFVLTTDDGSATRLIDILRACPIRGAKAALFDLYLVGR